MFNRCWRWRNPTSRRADSFNRCWRWRNLLLRRADSALTAKEWGSLQDHLASCAGCRQIAEADDALQSVMSVQGPRFAEEHAQRFDDAVLATLAQDAGHRTTPATTPGSFSFPFSFFMDGRLEALQRRLGRALRDLPLSFITQIGGGAVFAVGITAFFLMPALHYGSPTKTHSGGTAGPGQSSEMSGIPVSMSSLLNDPAPIAATLWSTPPDANRTGARDVYNGDVKRYISYPRGERNDSPNDSPADVSPLRLFDAHSKAKEGRRESGHQVLPTTHDADHDSNGGRSIPEPPPTRSRSGEKHSALRSTSIVV